jgi:hypothetical protein
MGRCHEKLGDAPRAAAALRRYLEEARDLSPADRAQIESDLRALFAPASPPPPAPAADAGAGAPAARISAAPAPAAERHALSHAGQPGAFLRADVAVAPAPGLVWLPGLSLGLGDFFEVGAAAFLGAHKGAVASARAYLDPGAWKPNASLGALLVFPPSIDRPDRHETLAGVQAGAGVQWDPTRHLGVSLDLTATFFPGAAADLRAFWLVPSLGVQGRL